MFLMTLRDLQYRAIRFAMVILGTALVFSLVLIMSGLSLQFRREARTTVDSLGADVWLVREGVSGPFRAGSHTVPAAVADDVRARGAKDATPVVIAQDTTSVPKGLDVIVIGTNPGWNAKVILVDGGPIADSGQALVSQEAKLKVGDKVEIEKKAFTVVGVIKGRTIFGGTPLVYMRVADAQQITFQGQPIASAIAVRGQAPRTDGLEAMTPQQTADDALQPLRKPVSAIDLVQLLLWMVAMSIIGVVVYVSALERTRDFAVMKAVGATSTGLLTGLAVQSVTVALMAAIVATGIEKVLAPLFPIPISVPGRAYVQLPVLALIAGVLASLGGLRRAVSVDPALAFGGP